MSWRNFCTDLVGKKSSSLYAFPDLIITSIVVLDASCLLANLASVGPQSAAIRVTSFKVLGIYVYAIMHVEFDELLITLQLQTDVPISSGS